MNKDEIIEEVARLLDEQKACFEVFEKKIMGLVGEYWSGEKLSSVQRQVTSKRGKRLDIHEMPDEWFKWCVDNFPKIEAMEEFEIFHDYWVAIPGQRGVKINWFSTWKNWVRRKKSWEMPSVPNHHIDKVDDARPGETWEAYRARKANERKCQGNGGKGVFSGSYGDRETEAVD